MAMIIASVTARVASGPIAAQGTNCNPKLARMAAAPCGGPLRCCRDAAQKKCTA